MANRKKFLTREYWQAVASHMHIYDTFHESLIKTMLFLVAFLVSVLPLFSDYLINYEPPIDNSTVQQDSISPDGGTDGSSTPMQELETSNDSDLSDSYIAAGGALIVYGISLIAEICMLLNPDDFLSKKFLIGSILLIGIVMTSFGFVQIFIPNITISPTLVTTIGSLSILVYIFDTVVYYLVRPSNKYSGSSQESKLKDIYVEV